MSHELTITAGRAEMAFVGETPWHGLGQRLEAGASIDDWRRAAGMDWEIWRAPVRFDVPTFDAATAKAGLETRTMADRVVLYRSDNNEPLSVVSPRFQEVQPAAALEFFRDLVEAGGYTIDTAGTLRGGRRLWALARTGQGVSLPGGDDVGGFLLVATACDGTMATTVRETTVRVVCANTLAAALGQSRAAVTVPHSTRFDAEKVKRQLREVSASFDAFAQAAEALARSRLSSSRASELLAAILPAPTGSKPIEETKGFKAIMELFNGAGKGATLPSASGTAWGLLNAVTEYVDHHVRAASRDTRLASAWFGSGDMLKTAALEKLTSAVA